MDRTRRVGAAIVAAALLLAPAPADAAKKPPPSSTTSKACGGKQSITVDKTGWTCKFSDDFDGTSLDRSKWEVVRTDAAGFHASWECFMDEPANVAVQDGVLNLTARTVPGFACGVPGYRYYTQWTSGMVSTRGHLERTYGRFQIRAAFARDTGPGVHSAVWLWPTDPQRYGAWPASGEIDVAEYYSSVPDRVYPYVHYQPTTFDYTATSAKCFVTNPWELHTYTLTWTRTTMTIDVDGTTCLKNSWKPAPPLKAPAPFDQPFYLNLTQALGSAQNPFDPAVTKLPATMKVDSVYVWG
ncbi:glycoside hydrolase family 16 protein [Aeromicrobium terrae]|uniref:Glycoside hydrolase family 16 protein n=1 Tax=Aeromicrobium terrae TaxID=2498846 RepID=A0A5C8NLN4_9ACTN|nr:glycoside hydrolase family 16 protein [Aeromicrobium terrae]TXL62056.1 glycoside hydrolase family 16 protein [Aeromicrobium terrae]